MCSSSRPGPSQRAEPVWDASMLVPEVVACCGRLPLTLKVGVAHAISVFEARANELVDEERLIAHLEAKLSRMSVGLGRPLEVSERKGE